jgi:CRP-like cAMP-binding protein
MTAISRSPSPRSKERLNPAALLARSRVFGAIEPDPFGRVVRGARRLNVSRGELVYGCGKRSPDFYVIGLGYASLSVQAEPDREKIVELRGPGECLGDEDLLAQLPRSVSATMLTDGVLVSIPHDVVLDALDYDPVLARNILADLSRRMFELLRQIEAKSTRCGIERVASYLMRLSGGAPDGSRDLALPAPKRVIASLLDLTKESFSRVLRELTTRRLIEVHGRTIRMLDMDGLARVCHRGRGCELCWGCARGGAWSA